MGRLSEFLTLHWFALVFLGVAAILLLKRWRIPAASLALFAAGGLSLSGVQVDLFGRFHLASTLFAVALFVLLLSLAVVVLGRAWSPLLAGILAVSLLLGLGGWCETDIGEALAEVARMTRSVQFTRPWWLALLLCVPVVLLLARRSLAGLGRVRKWVTIGTRCVIVALLALALAEPRVNRPSENVAVLFVLDRSQSVPQDIDPAANVADQVDRRWQRIRGFVRDAVLSRGVEHSRDKAGVVLFGKRPKLALPPASVRDRFEVDDRMAGPIDGQYTDIAAALKLAVASFPEGNGKRVVLVSDGNENMGNAVEQAAVAKQNGVAIDVVSIAPGYKNEGEVLVQSVEAPPVTTTGTRLPLRVLVRNTSATRVVRGILELVRVGLSEDGSEKVEQVAIEADQPQVLDAPMGKPATIILQPGLNSLKFRDTPPKPGETSFSYRATFTPILSGVPSANGQLGDIVVGLPNDRVANNRASTAVVMRGQRRVLFVEEPKNGRSEHAHLIRTLLRADVKVSVASPAKLPAEVADFALFLTNYDCIVLANVPAEVFSRDQMEVIRTSVHDQGTGLIMIGGPDSFGPGGYQNTPVEEALPVFCEIKSPMAAGKGGLILIMHASEMADGNHWQKVIAKLAIERLSAPDMIGVMQYGFGAGAAGVSWVIPFQDVGGDKSRLLAKIDRMDPQDMLHFDPFLTAAADTLSNPDYNLAVRHCIVISDGDPQYGPAGQAATAKMAANAITCTTVGVATHGMAETGRMKSIAEATKDGRGNPGSYYEPKDPSQLPAIYIKESRRISQSFIYDKAFLPKHLIVGGITEGVPRELPPLRGFVRTTYKESPLAQFRIEGPPIANDIRFPILASWQYGLGRAIAFTSDARTQPTANVKGWDADWVESDIYKKFWEQAITWSLRPAESGRMTVTSEYRGGRVRVTVTARDERDRPVNGLDLQGKISLPRAPKPGEKVPAVEFKRKGPGQYEAEFAADEAGTYFVTVQGRQPGVGKNTGAMFDTARTGVTLPYSQEFADLDTNTALLKQLAEITGGRYYTDDPDQLQQLAKSSELFREAPKTSRAYQPFWYWLVFAAGVLLLLDVGVRRIAVEWLEVRAEAARFWSRLREKPAAEASATLSQLQRRKLQVQEEIERERAARRFETTGTPPEPPPRGADEIAAGPTSPLPPAPPLRTEDRPKTDEPQDMMSRLKKARDRADHKKDKKDDTP
ncbi:VWA domain-containing protein [Limnoglobus roseus]|uniref:VWA domain-containing protein n=1 Tax=Limnoglobus roseus TaxID=2598579 RepID=A0A5C1AJS6_9BACT|nr:VWA domain-containing protein [Limnoglobus roseus]QEL18266.1 VWA domain-containing protein [Limnoglobus roseus]